MIPPTKQYELSGRAFHKQTAMRSDSTINVEKRCRYCDSLMNYNAVFCVTCSQYQNNTDRILSKLDISTIITIVPILTLCFTVVRDRVLFAYSDVNVVALHCTLDSFDLAVTNAGSKDGIITGGEAVQVIEEAPAQKLFLAGTAPTTILAPGSPKILRFTPRTNDASGDKTTFQPAPLGKACRYELQIDVVEFGSTEPLPKSTQCACFAS